MVESRFIIEAAAMQQGKTVAVGFWETDDDSSPFVVSRFHPDGSLDEDESILIVGDSGLFPYSSRLFRLDPDRTLAP